jgi:hypothetical protein
MTSEKSKQLDNFIAFGTLTEEDRQIILSRAERFGVTGYRTGQENLGYRVFGPESLTGDIRVNPTHPSPEIEAQHKEWMKDARKETKRR